MARAAKDRHTPNDTFASYRLVARVAVSQNFEIWEAQHGRSRRSHAMKVMLPSLRGQHNVIGYLRHEYNVARQFDHHTIIRADDFDIVDGIAYFVMEYFPAPNMKQWIRDAEPGANGLIPSIITNAATSLGQFHQQGWIHRDVKPDNFLVGEKGEVKLIDFTLAKRQRGWLGRLFESRSKPQGTMSYMSPEQILNKPQDTRSDIYSLGCVIFELVSGKPPYTGDSAKDLLNKHLRSPVPTLKPADGAVTDDFVGVVKQMIAKDPSDRPATMDDVLKSLKMVEVFAN